MNDNGEQDKEFRMTSDNLDEDTDESMNSLRTRSNNDKYPDSRLAGLTGWPPGTSGNLNGRPKGSKDSPRAQFNRLLAKNASSEEIIKFGLELEAGDHPRKAEVMALVLWEMIKAGDLGALREGFAQAELPHPRNLNVSGDFNVAIPSQFADAF